ncbi:MAG: AAA family ATPase [Verrucomicrobiota bacterium]|nr:AAA family ATPase [Verrucomicrobiota bacterium]
MRIHRLHIKSPWKNLEDFIVNFDERRDVAVIIGRNGSAKSNLLEAIITIFRNLDLNAPAPFAYELIYSIHGHRVVLTASADKQPKAEVAGKPVSLHDVRIDWTPKYVVGYYSGVSDRFEELFRKHDRIARDLTLVPTKHDIKPTKLALRRFICARPVHGLFALLAFYFSKDEIVTSFLNELPRIEAFDSAILVLRRPTWAVSKKAGAEEFWDAKGPVRELLDRFRRYSLVPFSRIVTIKTNFARRESRELYYLFLPDIKALHLLAAEYGSDPRALFQALDTMRLSGLIEDFRVRVRVKGSAGAIHTRQLSEGEQQLLTVLGLMRFTRNAGSLYLLDEPDTHLNPAWEVDYLQQLRSIGGMEQNSHTLLATHDPLLVAGLCKEEIRVLTRNQKGRILATEPEESPRGKGVASVLTSPLYGLESQLDPFSLRVLKRVYEVSMGERSEKKTRHLNLLRKLIPSLEIDESSPDPYRNIARKAYQLSQRQILDSDESTERKLILVDRLAEQLVEQTSKEVEK